MGYSLKWKKDRLQEKMEKKTESGIDVKQNKQQFRTLKQIPISVFCHVVDLQDEEKNTFRACFFPSSSIRCKLLGSYLQVEIPILL